MTALNVINSDEIETYLKGFCGQHVLLETCLIATLANILKKREECMEILEDLPEKVPAWLAAKWNTQEVWHKFNARKDIRLPGKVFMTVNWLEDVIAHDLDWLYNTDEKGRPKKLLKISSFDQLWNVMEKEERNISLKKRREAEIKLRSGNLKDDFRTVMKFEDGFHIVELRTAQALDIEGDFLEHCIGDGQYDYCLGGNVSAFYSLRNDEGLPCATLRIEKDIMMLLSASGRRNALPKNNILPYIATFCCELGVDIAYAFRFDEGFQMLRDDV